MILRIRFERAGAVEPCALEQILRHVAEAHQQENETRADVLPDRHRDHAPEGGGFRGQPGDIRAQKCC